MLGRRSPIIASTGRLVTSDQPQSPCTKPPSQRTYCTGVGSSSPICVRRREMSSAVTLGSPSYMERGPPGVARRRKKTTRVVASRRGTACSRRRVR